MNELIEGFKEGLKFMGWIGGGFTVVTVAYLIIAGVSELIVAIAKALKK